MVLTTEAQIPKKQDIYNQSRLPYEVPEVMKYRYQPFLNHTSIRLLILDPGRPGSPLTGRLEVADIHDHNLVYEAISYVWADAGPTGCKYEILLRDDHGDRLLQLQGGSIYAALHRVRHLDKERKIWADQVSVDQSSISERSRQVNLMGEIYRKASHVLVWLGLDPNDLAEAAFDSVKRVNHMFTNVKQGEEFQIDFTAALEHHLRVNRKFLIDLIERRWFRRGWIVQEIGTNAPATLLWGGADLNWEILYSVCEGLFDYHHIRHKLNINTSSIRSLYRRFIEPNRNNYHANHFSFLYELHRARGFEFTDDRDRIFAFLGHYSRCSDYFPNAQLASIDARYESSVEEIYVDLAKRALLGGPGSIALICLACVQHVDARYLSGESSMLPSWVPDWRLYQGHILSEPINPHRAHGTSEPDLEVIAGDRVLKIRGIKIDAIENCSRMIKSKEFHVQTSSQNRTATIEYLWRDICGKVEFNLEDKYVNTQSSFFAFAQTVSNGCVQIAGREGTIYQNIPDTRWLQEAALYLVSIKDCSTLITPDLRQLAQQAKHEHDKEEWSRSANSASKNRKFAKSKNGYYILGPAAMEEGDIISVLFGGKMPFVLRLHGSYFLLIGECYVHGLMNGEVMDMLGRGEVESKYFEIV